ncbi:hypothetical protein NECAME_03315 [Necator americanus]|uniref:SCP domain-containing protein n=1 Tax=Necator americanus TaxID=51031 RepID=W2T6V6_NECAM|nr:hypothetical protein NECAME_03315 [Necator americanus]ETN76886.1 hypothetical protein NECAME_03315 [Necator americanus]
MNASTITILAGLSLLFITTLTNKQVEEIPTSCTRVAGKNYIKPTLRGALHIIMKKESKFFRKYDCLLEKQAEVILNNNFKLKDDRVGCDGRSPLIREYERNKTGNGRKHKIFSEGIKEWMKEFNKTKCFGIYGCSLKQLNTSFHFACAFL